MKKSVLLIFLVLLTLVSAQIYGQTKTMVAFIDNSSGDNLTVAQEIDAQFMSDVLSGAKFGVVTRSNSIIKTLINENELSSSGLTTDAASQLRLLGVKYFVIFTVLKTNASQYSSQQSGNNSSSTAYTVDYVINTTAQVFNLQGQILASKDFDEQGSGSYSYTSDQYGSGYNGSYNDALNSAEQSAINNTALDLKMLLNNMILIQATVIKQVANTTANSQNAQSNDFIINAGSSEGAESGMKMTFVNFIDGVKMTDGVAQITAVGTNVAMIEVTKWPTTFSIIVGQTQVNEIPETKVQSSPLSIWNIVEGWGMLTAFVIADYFDPSLLTNNGNPLPFPLVLAIWAAGSIILIIWTIIKAL